MGIKSLFHVPHAGMLAKYDQRFILNLKLTHQLMAHLSKSNRTADKLYVELGPGAGALTRSLLTRPSVGVLGVEIDTRYNPLLEQIRSHTEGKFQYINGDVLNIDEFETIAALYPQFAAAHERRPTSARSGGGLQNSKREEILRKRHHKRPSPPASPAMAKELQDAPDALQWWAMGEAKVEVVANLPFSVITELLMRYAIDCSLQRGLFRFGRVPLHFFVQKEIAERLTAAPGTPQFSRLSVLAQNFFRVSVRQTFSEMTYFPRTEVLGCLVSLEPRMAPLVDVKAQMLIQFTDIVMKPGMRNTMVTKALHKCLPAEVCQYLLQELRIDGAVLPAQLSTPEIAKMALLWQKFLEATNQAAPPAMDGDEKIETHADDEGHHHQEDRHQGQTAARPFTTKEREALAFDWENEERYALRQRAKEDARQAARGADEASQQP